MGVELGNSLTEKIKSLSLLLINMLWHVSRGSETASDGCRGIRENPTASQCDSCSSTAKNNVFFSPCPCMLMQIWSEERGGRVNSAEHLMRQNVYKAASKCIYNEENLARS